MSFESLEMRHTITVKLFLAATGTQSCAVSCAGDTQCAPPTTSITGERYRTTSCIDVASGAFVDLARCGAADGGVTFEKCDLPPCAWPAAVANVSTGAWGPCSAECTALTSASVPTQTRCDCTSIEVSRCCLISLLSLVLDQLGMGSCSAAREIVKYRARTMRTPWYLCAIRSPEDARLCSAGLSPAHRPVAPQSPMTPWRPPPWTS